MNAPDVLHSRLACAVILADGSIGFSNAAFSTLLGYAPDDLARLGLTQLTDERVLAELRHSAHREQAGTGLDCSLMRSDGTPTWVHAVASPIADALDGAILLQVVSIERQKEVESALAVSESRLNYALEAAGQGVWDYDIVTGTMFYSAGWRRMRGIALDEYVDGSVEAWLERIHPDHRDEMYAAISRQNTEPQKFRVLEYRELHRDGRYIWIQSRGRTVAWDADGVAIRSLGTDTDITEIKERELEFQIVSRRLELALEVSRIGVWEQDLETDHVIWDARMSEIYGRSAPGEALSAQDWERAVHPADLQKAKSDFEVAVQNRSDYLSEFRIVLPNGAIRHIRSRGRYFSSPLGAGKLIGAEWDITHDVERTEQLYDARMLAEARFKDLQHAQKRIHHAALHDHLTDLPNRRYLDQKLAEQASLTDMHGRRLAVLHVDLDWFKQINDRFGHAAGDVMLQHVARTLRRTVRNDDFIARVGGDEFIVLSWVGDSDTALRADASRMIEALTQPVPHQGEVLQVGASIGIAYAGAEPVSAETLLQQADIALYRAKAYGRNRYELAPINATSPVAARS